MAEQNRTGGTAVAERPQTAPNKEADKAALAQQSARELVPFFAIDAKDKSHSAFVRSITRTVLSKLAKSVDNSKEAYQFEEMEKVVAAIDGDIDTIADEIRDSMKMASSRLKACMNRRVTLKGNIPATHVPYTFLGYRVTKGQQERELVRGILGDGGKEEKAEATAV